MKTLVAGAFMMCLTFLFQINTNSVVYSQEESKQKNDLVFDVQDLTTSPVTKNFKISGEVWGKVCPSNQCQIEQEGYSSYVVVPKPEDTDPSLYTTLYFYIHDNVTNKDLTPLQKKFVERYQFSFSCSVNSVKDIIEQGNNTIYKCSGDYTSLSKTNPEETDQNYFFQVRGSYDTQNDTLLATGVSDTVN